MQSDRASEFEEGLKGLGQLLGFSSMRPQKSQDGVPDGVWMLSDKFAFVFEAKSYEKTDKSIPISTVRQANTHEQWARDNCSLSSDADVVVIVVGEKRLINTQAKRNAGTLKYLSVSDVRTLAESGIMAMRNARSKVNDQSDSFSLQLVYNELHLERLLPSDISQRFESLKDLPYK